MIDLEAIRTRDARWPSGEHSQDVAKDRAHLLAYVDDLLTLLHRTEDEKSALRSRLAEADALRKDRQTLLIEAGEFRNRDKRDLVVENAALRKDAERYRWLRHRNCPVNVYLHAGADDTGWFPECEAALDDAIDAHLSRKADIAEGAQK